MKDGINFLVLILIAIILVLIVFYSQQYEKNKSQWNNGYCSCGGHWEYEQAIKDGDNITHIYRCDNCGKTIEVNEVQAFVVTIESGN